jgi:transporter family-2 protein
MSVSTPEPAAVRRSVPFYLVALGFLCGAGVAAQSRINGQLGAALHDGFAAALISFCGGLLIVLVALAFLPRGRSGVRRLASAVRNREIPPWYLIGGVCGALIVLSQGLTAAILGVALFSVGIVAGQTVGGIVVDRRGMGTMSARPLTAQRIVGSALALGAVALAGSAEIGSSVAIWVVVLPFIAGGVQAFQQAVNGQVRSVSDSTATTTLLNFITGATVLAVAFVIHSSIAGWPTHFPPQPWLYLGGVLGATFIAVSASIVRAMGVLLLSLATIAGQLVVALLLDIVAPTSRNGVTVFTVVGTCLTLVAVAIAALPRRIRS